MGDQELGWATYAGSFRSLSLTPLSARDLVNGVAGGRVGAAALYSVTTKVSDGTDCMDFIPSAPMVKTVNRR